MLNTSLNVAEYVRKHPNCNYFISASAGTGKTYTMVNYYVGILENSKNPDVVEKILTTTFTVKAAAEMKQRISDEILKMEKNSKGYLKNYWKKVKAKMSRALISTIDSFCQAILREENFSVNVDPNLRIINDLKRDKVIERSVYTAFRLFFEAYEGGKPDLPNMLRGSEREKRVEGLISDLQKDKEALRILFSEYRLDKLQEMIINILINWRTEMKRSNVVEYALIEDKIVYDALSAFKTLILIASEVYESMTSDISEFDYKGILEKTLDVLKIENIREKYSKRFKYILVDEYQDTNYLQKEIFDTLHDEFNYVFYVGDRKQSIYRFRGSDVTVFTTTYKQFKEKERNEENYKVLSLRKNYRSKRSLVEYFNELAEKTIFNRETVSDDISKIAKAEFPYIYEDVFFRDEDLSYAAVEEFEEEVPSISSNDRKRVKYVYAYDEKGHSSSKVYTEARTAAKIIKALVKKNPSFSYKDITILRRTLKSAENVYKSVFKEEGIPLYVVGGHSFYSRPEIEGIISALKAVQNPHNDYLFTAFFFSPLVGGDLEIFDKIVQKRDELMKENEEKISLFGTCEKILEALPDEISKAHSILKKYADLKYFIKPTEIVRGIVNDLDYFAKLSTWEDRKSALYNLKKLLSGMLTFDQMANSFSELIRLISRIKEKDEEEASLEDDTSNSVKLMTIHKSKGLEFKVVILGETFRNHKKNKEEVQFSMPRNGYRHFIMEKIVEENLQTKLEDIMKEFYINDFMNYTEERRLLYVAVTRASELFVPIFVLKSEDDIFSKRESFSKNLNVDAKFYDLVSVNDVVFEESNYFEKKEKIFLENVPSENLKSFESLSYKMYVAPTFLKSLKSEKNLDKMEELTDESEQRVINIEDIFSNGEVEEGQKIHEILSTVQNISDLKYLEEEGIVKPKNSLYRNPLIQKLFSYPISKVEWRLMKPIEIQGKNYMLFGIPDRVFIKDGELEVIDYKNSSLRGRHRKKMLDDYIFQIRFYMYMLSDFGRVQRGYIISTKTGEIVEVKYEKDFASKIVSAVKELEGVVDI